MTHSSIRLVVNGARGRMGARVVELARADARFEVTAAVDRDDQAMIESLSPDSVDAIVDFSSDEGARHAGELARSLRVALLVGTTGLSPETLDTLEESSQFVPAIIAANTSLGMAVLNHLAVEAARRLGDDFDVDILEAHHSRKRDAPSGTAARLVERLRRLAGVNLTPDRVHSLRAGDIVGEHSVVFSGPGERLKIIHQATNRDLFARGALRAVAWLVTRPPGHYSIEQALGLE